ncbi:MAG: DUF177 domain-containing protein [Bacteroidales bacterium]|nr:DUF177 domain-containing protein [Bacteroidales bacterium]
MKTDNQYIIAFKGLSEGSHDFVFNVGKSFIDDYEFFEARDGHLEVKVNMIKEATLLSFTISIRGFIEVQCDRCLDFFPLEIDYYGNLCAKFSEAAGESDIEMILLKPEDSEVDLRQYIFDSIGLSIPCRKVHPPDSNGEPSCNREMLARLNELLVSGDNNKNPMWDKLKDLK